MHVKTINEKRIKEDYLEIKKILMILLVVALTLGCIPAVFAEAGDNNASPDNDLISTKSVTDPGSKKKGQDYTVSYKDNKKAGTAKVIIAGAGRYKDAVTKTFTIRKAANKFKIKSVKRKVKAGKTVSGAKVIRKGTGTKTYKIKAVSKKKYAKYFKINKRSGKIKVNKKTPKGKYVVTVKAKAAKTANYKASAWKKAKVTIIVK